MIRDNVNKPMIGEVYQTNQVDGPSSLEPLLTPEQLVNRYLFGIPLVSQIRDPRTGKGAVMTPAMLKEQIKLAINDAELDTGIVILPRQFDEWQPFDRSAYQSFGYMMVRHRPANAVQSMAITSSDNTQVFNVPLEWISVSYPEKGQIGILPLTVASTNTGTVQSPGSGGALFLSILGQRNWISAFWRVLYTAGFPDGRIPVVVNTLIGTIAAMRILGMLGATFSRSTGGSLSIDGLSQGYSGPGPNVYQIRIGELAAERDKMVRKLKAAFGASLFASNL